ncbi:Gfo/Idh/MocA family oxidoreductase [Acidobacteria bacterium AH-259-O06]|nr:Gfo/Idh/MocA family oxidoreductase [Acidobacteria bacterium AH-259-O06]
MATTKVAVVGVGALGEQHARVYYELPEAELVAVVDIEEERVQRAASLYQCQSYRRYQHILTRVEAISLAVPTQDHAGIGVDFLQAGVHVLIEKPIAQNLEEADQLIQMRRKSGAVLHIGHSERFNPALLAVTPYITQPKFFEAHRLGVFIPRSLDIDVVLDLMIHDLDLILHLVDCPIREIRAVGIPILTPRIDIANARLEFENSCVANVTASRVSNEKIRKLRFFQPQDYVSIDFHRQNVEMYSLLDRDLGRKITGRSFEIRRQEPLKLEIQAFLRAVQDETPSPQAPAACSGEEGRRALALALEVKRAIEKL